MDHGVRQRNGYYFLDFYHLGKRYRLYTTLADCEKNKPKAVKLLNMLKIDLERNQFNVENYKFKFRNIRILERLDASFKSTSQQHSVTLEHLINEQIQRYRQMVEAGNLAVSTFDCYYYAINLHLLPHFKNLTLHEVNINTLEQFISQMPFSRNRIRIILRPLHEIFKKAKKSGIIVNNPMEAIDSDTFKTHAVRSSYKISPFTQTEVESILAATEHETVRNMIATGFYTGMRIGELFALTWDDVNFAKDIIHVVKAASIKGIIKEPKTSAGIRNIEMIPKAKAALLAQYKVTGTPNGRVFKTPTGRHWIKTDSFGRYWRTSLTLAKVPYRNPYQMRHTFISTMLALGNNPMVLYPMAGHTNPQVIYQVYGKYIQNNNVKVLKTE